MATAFALLGSVEPPTTSGPHTTVIPEQILLGNLDGFTLLQKKELFLRNAYWYLKEGTLPPKPTTRTNKADFGAAFRKRVKRSGLALVWDGHKAVLIKQSDLRRVSWEDETFKRGRRNSSGRRALSRLSGKNPGQGARAVLVSAIV